MGNGNRPEIANHAGKIPLDASPVDPSDSEMDSDPLDKQQAPMQVAADALRLTEDSYAIATRPQDIHISHDRVQLPKLDTRPLAPLPDRNSIVQDVEINAEREQVKDTKNEERPQAQVHPTEHYYRKLEPSPSSRPTSSRQDDREHVADNDSLATSPALSKYTIPVSHAGSPMDILPAMQISPPQTSKPPSGQRSLPSIHAQLGSLADGPPHPENGVRGLAIQSTPFHSINGTVHSPPKEFKPMRQSHFASIQTRTSGSFRPGYPTTEPSPASTVSDVSPRDYRPGNDPTGMSPPAKYSRQFSNGLTPQSDLSVQTPQSAESQPGGSVFGSVSTETSPNGDRMSVDTDRPILPPLTGNGPIIGPGFRCDFGGCTAAPFQTQYLLNSHANVHSQIRSHYCPVKECNRSEGGKGFKRKNEMIRHGLVHQSPGYICPFCPEREHKYPRPDNLQRHVRVHHTDKDKDDAQLREVLAQRPEGSNRGRRRRVGGG
ncbi:hypothetical protein MMC13_007723 [Lambiella insularis]|nr:hypothetical protein [Lambiella insularis]